MSVVTSSRVRRVIVDDEDRNIIYRGPWAVDRTSFGEHPNFGYVYRGSQHRLLGDTGSLTFRFTGSGSVGIYGTSNVLNASGVYDPFHTCELDGVDVPPEKPLRNLVVNLWPLCTTNATDDGDHVLTLSAVSNSMALFVDQLAYIPDRRSPPPLATVGISQDDLAVEYLEGSWQTDGASGMLTEEAGAKMSVTFTGSSARFIGSVPVEYPGGNSTATYSIDGAPPVTFTVPGLGRNNLLPMFGQPFFEVTDLGSGVHELIVTHNGPAAPLVFDYLEVEDGDILQSALSREVEEPNASGGKKAPLGAIIGGAVGGAVFLLVLIALLLILKKRKKRQHAQATAAAAVTITPLDTPKSPLSPTYEVKPLIYSDQSPPSTFQTMSNPGTGDSLQHGPMPGFYGEHTNHSTPSHPGNQLTNPSAHYPSPNSFGPPARVNMSITYAQNGQPYSRAPEPMA